MKNNNQNQHRRSGGNRGRNDARTSKAFATSVRKPDGEIVTDIKPVAVCLAEKTSFKAAYCARLRFLYRKPCYGRKVPYVFRRIF